MGLSASEIRRRNFAAAVESAGGVEPFANRYDMNPDYMPQLMRGGGPASTGRNIGHRSARNIEAKLWRAPNALDQALDREAVKAVKKNCPPLSTSALVEHEMSSVRYALGALETELAYSRPVEAKAFEAELREAPASLKEHGFLADLLGILADVPRRPSLLAGRNCSAEAAKDLLHTLLLQTSRSCTAKGSLCLF